MQNRRAFISFFLSRNSLVSSFRCVGRIFFVILICCMNLSPQHMFAADDSTTVQLAIPTFVRFVHQKGYQEEGLKWQIPDSTLNHFQDVDPAIKYQYNHLGVLGSACSERIFSVEDILGNRIGLKAYQLYLWNEDSLRFYRSNKRYSQIDYHNGSFKEQEIRVLHSQNILKTWSVGLDFHRLGVKDYTRNSDTFQNQLALFTWYESANQRLNSYFAVVWNAFKNQLNGGLSNDSLYEEGSVTNLGLKGLSTGLSDAKHQVRNHFFSLHNDYLLHTGKDSVTQENKGIEFHVIQSTYFESGAYAYSDGVTDSAYYSHFYQSPATYDSLHYYNMKNSAGIYIPASEQSSSFYFRNFHSVLEAEQQWFGVQQRDEYYSTDYSLKLKSYTEPSESRFGFRVSADYIFAGDQRGMLKFVSGLNSPLWKAGILEADLSYSKRKADFMYQHYYSNHFIWNNSFENIQTQTFRLSLSHPGYRYYLGLAFNSLKNYVYANKEAVPEQEKDQLSISQLFIRKNFVYRKLHFDNEICYQHSNREYVIALPSWNTVNSLYIEKNFYQNALLAQFGLSLRYHSAYYSDAFMPATAFFYVQEQKQTGDYAVVDLFFNIKIKSARLFLKIQNLGDGLWGNYYYLSPGYPQAGRTLQFGLSWRFYDQ